MSTNVVIWILSSHHGDLSSHFVDVINETAGQDLQDLETSCRARTQDYQDLATSCRDGIQDPQDLATSCWARTQDPQDLATSCWARIQDPQDLATSCQARSPGSARFCDKSQTQDPRSSKIWDLGSCGSWIPDLLWIPSHVICVTYLGCRLHIWLIHASSRNTNIYYNSAGSLSHKASSTPLHLRGSLVVNLLRGWSRSNSLIWDIMPNAKLWAYNLNFMQVWTPSLQIKTFKTALLPG